MTGLFIYLDTNDLFDIYSFFVKLGLFIYLFTCDLRNNSASIIYI